VDKFLTQSLAALWYGNERLVSANEAAGATVLARLADGTPVAARQGHWLVTSFHPELTDDLRLHQYFVNMVAAMRSATPVAADGM
jgi:5'-phosphate synthase pdxT subunit